MIGWLQNIARASLQEPVGLISLAVTVLFGCYQIYSSDASEEQALVEARAAEIRVQALDFQTYMAAYVAAVLDKEPTKAPAEKLTENVMRQFASVELSKAIYTTETEVLAAAYRTSLTEFQGALVDVKDVTDMRPFWEAASDVLTSRDKFLEALSDQ